MKNLTDVTENKDIATKEYVDGVIPTPLIGTTVNTTPTQVATALAAGRNIEITHTDSTYGDIVAYSFNYSEEAEVIVSNTIMSAMGWTILIRLFGDLSDNIWSSDSTNLANFNDIPTATSDLTNDSGFIDSIKTINNTSLVGSGNVDVQPTLVSGMNIKTINNTSLLGSGNISIQSEPEIFIAEYNVTTYANVKTAYDSGKTIICRDGTVYYQLNRFDSLNNLFVFGNTDAVVADQISLQLIDGWDDAQTTIPVINLNGLSDAYPSFYAPTSAGTSGQYLQSNGINQSPSWINFPTIPTKTSDLTNDSGFITSETDPIFTASAAHGISASDITNWNSKQAALVSGTNIKTINNTSLLGSGNISVQSEPEIFVAEYNVTTYAEILTAHNANKTIICKIDYHYVTPNAPTGAGLLFLPLVMAIPGNLFQFGIEINNYKITAELNVFDEEDEEEGYNWSFEFGTSAQSDWDTNNIDSPSYIKNKPTIPTKTSDLTNDSGFINNIKTINNTSLVGSGNVAVQPTLVSGTNIKTINNTSLLGSGNISIGGTQVQIVRW